MQRFAAPERGRVPYVGDERSQLNAWLDFYRATLLFKCDGLSVAQMKHQPVAGSNLSLLGIIRHMTFVEQTWSEATFAGRTVEEYYQREDDRDADFNDLDSDAFEVVIDRYLETVERSRALTRGHALDEMASHARRGRHVDLRWIYVHLIEEYARHCGHADLLREMIDGVTGY